MLGETDITHLGKSRAEMYHIKVGFQGWFLVCKATNWWGKELGFFSRILLAYTTTCTYAVGGTKTQFWIETLGHW